MIAMWKLQKGPGGPARLTDSMPSAGSVGQGCPGFLLLVEFVPVLLAGAAPPDEAMKPMEPIENSMTIL